MNNLKFGVIGGGSWATAIVKMLGNNHSEINWWLRRDEQVDHINKYGHNPKYLRSAELNANVIIPSSNLQEVIHSSDILIIATPSAFVYDVFGDVDIKGKRIVSAIKGIIPQTNEIPLHYFASKDVKQEDIAIICGPCHAEEVAMERLSYLTIAGKDDVLVDYIITSLSCRYIKCTPSRDIIGAEISAVLKNVYALAGGIANGLGYGDNFMSVLISNAIKEINGFVDAVAPLERNVCDSAYLGDLLVTAYSIHSRNRSFGSLIGKGYSLESVQREMNMVAEGFYAVECIYKMNKNYSVNLPIANAVYEVLYKNASVQQIFNNLTEKLA